tara:strand:- start:4079 stop:4309 length:231 start_codon:yes stop_codon:yes gene_type:complete
MAWQSIETAPKDGTMVLVWWPCWSDHAVVAAYSPKVGSWWAHEQLADENPEPTHWMPLPIPPSESEAQELSEASIG